MVHRPQVVLHVDANPESLSQADDHPDFQTVHHLRNLGPPFLADGTINNCDLPSRNTFGDQPVADVFGEIEPRHFLCPRLLALGILGRLGRIVGVALVHEDDLRGPRVFLEDAHHIAHRAACL